MRRKNFLNRHHRFILLSFLLLVSCSNRTSEQKHGASFSGLPYIEGRPEYLASPYVTAGDRVYVVGHQDGSFPDLGWHVEGEMGGIWDHPIKLMDGFTAMITTQGDRNSFCLSNATRFINYPVGNEHHFSWEQEELSVDRFQFVPDNIEGAVFEFRIKNRGNKEKEITFSFTAMTDLRPTWLGERTDMIDADDEIRYDKSSDVTIARDTGNPWFVAFGSSVKSTGVGDDTSPCIPAERKGLGKNATMSFELTADPGEEITIPVYIAGSFESEAHVRKNYESVMDAAAKGLISKINRYKQIKGSSNLIIPDSGVAEMYEWLKYNSDWLIRNVPGQGIGISAGLPDYPWWFGADMAYALQGVLATGGHELAKKSIILLHEISERTNGNGRIVHEVSTNGAVYNPGNVNETAQFISLLHTYFLWTGDRELIERLFPSVRKGIQWLLKDMDPDGNGYPNGSGMMEIPGLDTEMIDVAVYTQQALSAAAQLAIALGETGTAEEYADLAETLRVRINSEWWSPSERSFGDFRGTVAEALPILKAALVRADTLKKPWAVEELRAIESQFRQYAPAAHVPHVIYHNWVVNTPMETGIADPDKGKQALQTATKYENPFGVFVTGIDRTEEADSVVLKSRKKTFSYTGAVMTLPTGVQAVAAARYGTPDESLDYIHKLQRSFSYALPGSMYEVSPDFGMVTQAWNIYGVAIPVVQYFFGLRPDADRKTVHITPRMPQKWNDATLENVRVGENSITLTVTRKENHHEYHIRQTLPDWNLSVNVKGAKKVLKDSRELDINEATEEVLVKGREVVMRIYY